MLLLMPTSLRAQNTDWQIQIYGVPSQPPSSIPALTDLWESGTMKATMRFSGTGSPTVYLNAIVLTDYTGTSGLSASGLTQALDRARGWGLPTDRILSIAYSAAYQPPLSPFTDTKTLRDWADDLNWRIQADESLSQKLLQTNQVPEGQHSIYVWISSKPDGQGELLADAAIRTQLNNPQPPRPLSPTDQSVVKEMQPRFTWEVAVASYPLALVMYNLRIVEVLPGQSPAQALRTNPVYFQTEIKNGTQFTYPADALALENNTIYAWEVGAFNEDDTPISTNYRSEPFSFTFSDLHQTTSLLAQTVPINTVWRAGDAPAVSVQLSPSPDMQPEAWSFLGIETLVVTDPKFNLGDLRKEDVFTDLMRAPKSGFTANRVGLILSRSAIQTHHLQLAEIGENYAIAWRFAGRSATTQYSAAQFILVRTAESAQLRLANAGTFSTRTQGEDLPFSFATTPLTEWQNLRITALSYPIPEGAQEATLQQTILNTFDALRQNPPPNVQTWTQSAVSASSGLLMPPDGNATRFIVYRIEGSWRGTNYRSALAGYRVEVPVSATVTRVASGTITNENGSPVSGLNITLTFSVTIGRIVSQVTRNTRTNAQGQFRFEETFERFLAPTDRNRIPLTISVDGGIYYHSTQLEGVWGNFDATRLDAELRADRQALIFVGRVADELGQAVVGASISVQTRPNDGTVGGSIWEPISPIVVESTRDGRFRIQLTFATALFPTEAQPRQFRLQITPPAERQAQLQARTFTGLLVGQDILDYEAVLWGNRGRIEGQMVREDTQQPLTNATLELLATNGDVVRRGAIQNGRFSFADLVPGTYQMRLIKADYEDHLPLSNPVLAQPIRLDWAQTENLGTLKARPSDKIFYLNIRNAQNQPAAGTVYVMNDAQLAVFRTWQADHVCATGIPLANITAFQTTPEDRNMAPSNQIRIPRLDPDLGSTQYHLVAHLNGHGFSTQSWPGTGNGVRAVSFALADCPTVLSGIVRRSDTNGAVPNAQIAITSGNMRYTMNTDADGRFFFTQITGNRAYSLTATHNSIGNTTISGIQVDEHAQRQVDVMLHRRTGIVSGYVRDENGRGIFDVPVLCSGILGHTTADGHYQLDRVPEGQNLPIVALKAGYSLGNTQVTVTDQQTSTVDFRLTAIRGTLRVDVFDLAGNRISGARVELPALNRSIVTPPNGVARFDQLASGRIEIRTYTPDAAMVPVTQTVEANFGAQNEVMISIRLATGMIVHGTVRDTNARAVSGARVEVRGRPDIFALTDVNGAYTLHGVPGTEAMRVNKTDIPAQNPFVDVTKAGYESASHSIRFDAGGSAQSDFALTRAPFDRFLGFSVALDDLREENGTRYATGQLVGLINTPILTIDSQLRLPFANVALDAQNRPAGGRFTLAISSIPLRVYGFQAVLQGVNGGALEIIAQPDGVGAIRGEIVVQMGTVMALIPGSSGGTVTIPMPASCDRGACLTANGISRFAGDLTLPNLNADLTLWGYDLNFSRFVLSQNRLCVDGNIETEALDPIHYTGLCVATDGTVTPPTIQQFGFSLDAFRFQLNQIRLDGSGLRASSGSLGITGLGPNGGNLSLNFRNLILSTTGGLVRADLEIPRNQLSLPGFTFQISEAGLVTQAQRLALRFSGSLALPDPIGRDLYLQSLEIAQNGGVSAILASNTRIDLSGIQVLLSRMQFSVNAQSSTLALDASLDFPIPGMPAPSAAMTFTYRNGNVSFGIQEVAVPTFSLGPVSVRDLRLGYRNSTFSGGLRLDVAEAFGVGASFSYRDTRNYGFSATVGVPIILGPVEISEFTGGMSRNGDAWRFFLRDVTLGFPRTQDALALVGGLEVQVSNGGPVIAVDGRLTAVGGQFNLGTANLILDVPRGRLEGNSTIQNPFGEPLRTIADAEGAVDIRVGWSPRTGELQYWYTGARVDIVLFRTIANRGRAFFGYRYRPFGDVDQHFRDYFRFHPATDDVLNGVYVSAYSGGSIDLGVIDGGADQAAYFIYDWAQGRASGGAYARVYGTFDLYVASLGASFKVKGEVQYNGAWDISGHASSNLKATVWPCDSGSSCSRWCAGCLSVSADLAYRNGGFDVDVDW